MQKPQPKLLLNPPASAWGGSLRESQEQQLSATAFGRALLERTREARARHIVVDRLREQWTCPICDSFFVVSGESGTTGLVAAPLGAEHKHAIYCHHCLCQWIEAQLSENCSEVRCLIDQCPVRLEPFSLKGVLAPALVKKWDAALLMTALKAMPDLRYCPVCSAPGYIKPGCSEVECLECAYLFCSTCMMPKHAAIRCSQAVYELDPEVQKRFWEDRLSAQWKASHTKACPKCRASIEKNEGCSHMTCRSCKYEFCWICLQKYQGKYITGAAANGSVCPCPPPPGGAPVVLAVPPLPPAVTSTAPPAGTARVPPAAAKPPAAAGPRP